MNNADLLANLSWEHTDLGPISGWRPEMKAVIDMVLASAFPMCTVWGADDRQIYNDSYNKIYGHKHPGSFGAPVQQSFPEIADFLLPALQNIRETKEPFVAKSMMLPLLLNGRMAEWFFDFSYSPIVIGGHVAGIVSVAAETTEAVLFARRQVCHREINVTSDTAFGDGSLIETIGRLARANAVDMQSTALFSVDPLTGIPLETVHVDGFAPDDVAACKSLVLKEIRSISEDSNARERSATQRRLHWASIGEAGAAPLAYCVVRPDPLVTVDASYADFLNSFFGHINSRLASYLSNQRALQRSHNALVEEETFHKILFEQIRDGAFYCATDGKVESEETVLAVNPQGCALLARPADDIIGRNSHDFFSSNDLELREALKQRHACNNFLGELTILRADGTPTRVELNSTLIVTPFGGKRSLTIVRDISARKQREVERAELARLETLGRVAGGVAHDLNNLLQTQTSNLEIALDLADAPTVMDQIEAALAATESSARLASQLLSYSRKQNLDVQSVDLANMLAKAEGLLRAAVGNRHRLVIQIEPDLPPLVVDPAMLTNALVNLLINSRQAMSQGGDVTLCISLHPGTERQVSISVSDTGDGIPAEIIETVFEPYVTNREGGTGLGLAMVEGFVAQSGGRIAIAHTGPDGTKIEMLFPIGMEHPSLPTRG